MWSSSFCIVYNCFDDFRTNLPKNNGQSYRKENINFPKWRWVRPKSVCLSSALLFSLVVTKNYVLRASWGLPTWNKTCFLFKCRVTFRLGQFSKARFVTLALYILRSRSVVISNTYKNGFFLEENSKFPKQPWVRSENVFLSSARLDSLVVNKKAVLRTCWDLSTWNKTCFLLKCRVTFWLRYFSNATFGTLALYILHLSCLAIPKLRKKQLLIFSEMWSSSFCIVYNCFDDFRTNLPKNNGQSHRKENINFPKWRWVRPKSVCLSSALLFSLVVTKIYVLRASWGLPTWNKTCFLFKCRVTFRLGQFSKARFVTLALYILRLRSVVISNTYRNGLFLEENSKFPKRPWVHSKNDFLSSALLFSLVVTKKYVLRTSWGLSTWNKTCFLFKCRVTFRLR